ncbi:MAG TPA: hypothetical protein VJ123_02895 [Anaerolineales bacterium]|nr:hypothetical protein [Anaerolineales bacterium]
MASKKLRTHRTDTDNLVSNLRGEIGDIVTTWVLYRTVRAQAARQASGDLEKDLADRSLAALHMVADKLRDALIAQLSELGQKKVGRLNFYFAAIKLKAFEREAADFARYVDSARFTEKRNYDISHKELPETWSEHKHIHVEERAIVRAIATAHRLIKRIDASRIGPAALYLWREVRRKRYELHLPGKVGYMLLPYMNPGPEARQRIVEEEERAGKNVWIVMPTMVNGRPATIRVAKEWGVIDLASIKYMVEKPEDASDA